MRTKDEILEHNLDDRNWLDQDHSRKAHQTDILIELLIDIRDTLVKLEQIQRFNKEVKIR